MAMLTRVKRTTWKHQFIHRLPRLQEIVVLHLGLYIHMHVHNPAEWSLQLNI